MVSSLIAFTTLATLPQVDVTYERFANLTYQLDNVTGQMPWEGSQNYRRLWEKRFLETSEDREKLERWKVLRFSRESQPVRQFEVKFPIVPVSSDETSETKLREAGFEASSVSDYVQRASRVVDKKKARELGEIIAHFEPRYNSWWKEVAEPKGRSFANSMVRMLEGHAVRSTLADFRDFYQADLGPGDTVRFSMLYRPDDLPEDINGQQLGRHVVFQFTGNEAPAERLEVMGHELCHYFYQMAAQKDHAGMQKRFLESKHQPSVPAYNLLNEAVATALGNGVLAEKLQTPEAFARHQKMPDSFYSDPIIDKAGKSIFPWIRDQIRAGKNIFDSDFADGYLSRVNGALGPTLQKPTLFFKALIVVADEKLGQGVFQGVSESLEPGNFTGYVSPFSAKDDLHMLESSPYTSSVLIIRPEAADRLAEWGYLSSREVAKAKQASGPHLILAKPNPNAVRAVILARSEGEASSALRKLSRMDSVTQGLVGK